MKLTNVQLKLLVPILLKAAKDEPNIELDEVIDRLIEMAQHRGMTMTRVAYKSGDPLDMQGLAMDAKANRPERAVQVGQRERVTLPGKGLKGQDSVHPLFRDPDKKSSAA